MKSSRMLEAPCYPFSTCEKGARTMTHSTPTQSEFNLSPTREIPLTKGKVAIVDAADYEWLNQWRWHARGNGSAFYASRKVGPRGATRYVHMHRLIVGVEVDAEVDHINGDGLDNRRANLRSCSHRENTRSLKLNRNSQSGFKGVSWHKARGKWVSHISVDGRQRHLGIFDDPVKAAVAYDLAAKVHFGEYAKLNFPEIERGG